jgi:ABC-2 type transport system permease protein
MSDYKYIRFEVIRNFRIWQFLFFSLTWPLILFLTIAESNRHHTFDGVSFPLYFMTAMAAMGAMIAVVSRGALIANDRSIGWTRHMRITPLRARAYFAAKVLCGYLMALATVAALGLAGSALGVRLSAGAWLTVVGLFLAGLVPFAVLGILLGHLLSPDSVVPAVGGITTLFALVGGAYGFQIATSGVVLGIMKALPSYWLVQAGRAATGSGGWPAEAWIVIAVWTAVLAPAAVLVYQRDTSRV